jgi:L-ribulokinase
MHSMGQGFEKTYLPQPEKINYYENRYKKYLKLGKQIESTGN